MYTDNPRFTVLLYTRTSIMDDKEMALLASEMVDPGSTGTRYFDDPEEDLSTRYGRMMLRQFEASLVYSSRPAGKVSDIPERVAARAVEFWDNIKDRPMDEIGQIITFLQWQTYFAKMDAYLDKSEKAG